MVKSYLLYFFWGILVHLATLPVSARELVIWVDPNFSPVQTELMHCRTLEEAKDLLFASSEDSVRIVLADGIHSLSDTFTFHNQGKHVILQSEHRNKAVLTHFNPVESKLNLKNDIVSFAVSEKVFILLNNECSIPIAGSHSHHGFPDKCRFVSVQKESGKDLYSAILNESDLKKIEVGCYFNIYCKWINYRVRVFRIDKSVRKVFFEGSAINVNYLNNDKYTFFTISNSRFFLSPGTFCCLDNVVYYKLRQNETIHSISFCCPKLETLMKFDNINSGSVLIDGLHFKNGAVKYFFMNDNQAASMLPAAVRVLNSNNIHFVNCEFSDNMGYSVTLENSKNCSIKNSYFHDLGGGGIKIRKNSSNIDLGNNLIKSFGRTFSSAVGVFIASANHVKVTHHTICDGFYSGISVGYTWGYGKPTASNIYLANNHIHHLMQGVLSDGAGIYTLGVQPGTIIENNHIHDIVSRAFNAAGSSLIYLDEGSSEIVIRNNVCYGSHTGFHQHFGRNNLVSNNFFAYTNLAAFRLSNAQKSSNLQIHDNIILADCGKIYTDTLAKHAILSDNKTLKGKIINKEEGVVTSKKGLAHLFVKYVPIEKVFSDLNIDRKNAYGVTSSYLKDKSRLSSSFLNSHNQMVKDNFPTYSSYFKRVFN